MFKISACSETACKRGACIAFVQRKLRDPEVQCRTTQKSTPTRKLRREAHTSPKNPDHKYMLFRWRELQVVSVPGCLSQETCNVPKQTSGGILCISGNRICVPISLMCTKQTAESHSSAEAGVPSLDAGLKMEGLPYLILLDCMLDVLAQNFSPVESHAQRSIPSTRSTINHSPSTTVVWMLENASMVCGVQKSWHLDTILTKAGFATPVTGQTLEDKQQLRTTWTICQWLEPDRQSRRWSPSSAQTWHWWRMRSETNSQDTWAERW